MSRTPSPPLAAALLLLAGCTPAGDFPSLAPRPIEKVDLSDAPPPAPAETGADAALLKRLAPIIESGEAGHRDFIAELATAHPAIERGPGAAQGSEAWVAAQQAFSRLDAARGPLLSALADLDALRREQVDSPNPGNHAAIDRAAQRLTALDAEEAQVVGELAAKLG